MQQAQQLNKAQLQLFGKACIEAQTAQVFLNSEPISFIGTSWLWHTCLRRSFPGQVAARQQHQGEDQALQVRSLRQQAA